MFTGTYSAIVTPFKNRRVDETALRRLIQLQVKGGVDGIVPVGTTGESPTVSYEEHVHIIDLAVRFAAGKIKVLAGTGGNSDRVSQLRAALGPRFEIMCGDDALTLSFMAVGAQGVISVASNLIPRQIVRMVQSAAAGQCRAALKLHQRYYVLFKDLFLE